MYLPWERQQLDEAITQGAAYVKIGIVLGCACLLAYSLRIGRFPQGVTLGDSVILILVASCFGAVIGLFVAAMSGLGITIVACALFPLRRARPYWRWLDGQMGAAHLPLPQATIFTWLMSPFAALMVIALARVSPQMWFLLPLLSVCLVPLIAVYLASHRQMANTGKQGFWHVSGDRTHSIARSNVRQLRSINLGIPGVVLFIVLYIAGGPLLDAAMRFAHIRVEQAVVHVKAPYDAMLPVTLPKLGGAPPYSSFKNITVLFTGIGNSTAIEFVDGDLVRQLDIPNDSILIEQRKPRKSHNP